jgi:hypothetical protein
VVAVERGDEADADLLGLGDRLLHGEGRHDLAERVAAIDRGAGDRLARDHGPRHRLDRSRLDEARVQHGDGAHAVAVHAPQVRLDQEARDAPGDVLGRAERADQVGRRETQGFGLKDGHRHFPL